MNKLFTVRSRPLIAILLPLLFYDTFRAIYRDRRFGKDFVRFCLDATGRIDKLELVDFRTFERMAKEAQQATQTSR